MENTYHFRLWVAAFILVVVPFLLSDEGRRLMNERTWRATLIICAVLFVLMVYPYVRDNMAIAWRNLKWPMDASIVWPLSVFAVTIFATAALTWLATYSHTASLPHSDNPDPKRLASLVLSLAEAQGEQQKLFTESTRLKTENKRLSQELQKKSMQSPPLISEGELDALKKENESLNAEHGKWMMDKQRVNQLQQQVEQLTGNLSAANSNAMALVARAEKAELQLQRPAMLTETEDRYREALLKAKRSKTDVPSIPLYASMDILSQRLHMPVGSKSEFDRWKLGMGCDYEQAVKALNSVSNNRMQHYRLVKNPSEVPAYETFENLPNGFDADHTAHLKLVTYWIRQLKQYAEHFDKAKANP